MAPDEGVPGDDEGLQEVRRPEDLDLRWIVRVGLGTGGFVIASLAATWLFYREAAEPGRFRPPARFPEPRLQSDPAGDLRDFRAQQAKELEGYAWADRERGLVRIPVARAMELVAGRGAAAYDPPPGAGPETPPGRVKESAR